MNNNLFILMGEILRQRRPALAIKVGDVSSLNISKEDRIEICNVLAEELVESGLSRSGEPNCRGVDIDTLIGLMSRPLKTP